MSSTKKLERSSTFKSIKGKLIFSFSLITLIIILMVGSFFWFQIYTSQLNSVNNTLKNLSLKVKQASDLEKDFFIEETINLTFYETGQSPYIFGHKKLLDEIKTSLLQLKTTSVIETTEQESIDEVIVQIDEFRNLFDSLTQVILKRGFRSYGTEGDMRRAISRVLNSGFNIDEVRVLTIRRREKDYMLRKDEAYIEQLLAHVDTLGREAEQIQNDYGRFYTSSNIEQYKNAFLQVVELDKRIGFQGQNGLRNRLALVSDKVEARIQGIDNEITDKASAISTQITTSLIILFIIFIALIIGLSIIVTRSLNRPIFALSGAIRGVVQSNFEDSVVIPGTRRKDEIGRLASDFKLMLEGMQERTDEVIQQKQQVTEAYENLKMLRRIGQNVTSTLSIDKIIETVYINLTKLIDVTVFHIGIYDKEDNVLEFRGSMVGGKLQEEFKYPIDSDILATMSFMQQKTISIENMQEAKADTKYVKIQKIGGEEKTNSIIYIPLTSKEKRIGVLTVQHEEPSKYSEYQLNIIRNLAVYTEIALDNALIYVNLEELVLERTSELMDRNQEVMAQKEEIESQKTKTETAFNNIKLLSEIGSQLNSFLSVEKINETLYHNIRKLMDAYIFGIGVIQEGSNEILFQRAVEGAQLLEDYSYKLDDTHSYAVYSVNNRKELIINDLEKEFDKYDLGIEDHLKTQEGLPRSIIYIPLVSKDNIIGIMGIQSLKAHAYQAVHLSILRNLANYAAIALENARAYQQIEAQHIEIESNNKKITSSINYARRIQTALLPDLEGIQKILPNSFLLLRPRDIVSGDFFWYAKVGDKVVLAAVDCTGHGVPGAFMSMIGNELLDKVVEDRKITHPDIILDELRKGVRKILKQQNERGRSQDGMDAAICTIDIAKHKLEYAGANNPLIYIQDGTTELIDPDKMAIGGRITRKELPYKRHIISLNKPTSIYIFSDGYQDQFGGFEERGKKYSKKRLKNTFEQIHKSSPMEQKTFLEKNIEFWMSPSPERQHKQIDDILIFGAQIDFPPSSNKKKVNLRGQAIEA